MKSRPAAVIFIFITIMLDMLALGLIAPVLPKLILDFRGGDSVSAANWLGWFGTIFALLSKTVPSLPDQGSDLRFQSRCVDCDVILHRIFVGISLCNRRI